MNKHVNAIAGRLSLRPPQRRSLEILDRVAEISPPAKNADVAAALVVIRSEYPAVTDFEREIHSLCFALATGVGKTRLMGAFISYLHLAHGINNFFVLAPNLTIYNKLIGDFTPNTPKYVFKGIAEFAQSAPEIITGDNYDQRAVQQVVQAGQQRLDGIGSAHGDVRINIFNISKINSEVRGGKAPRIKRLSEYIGESYFNYLAELPDLVLLMDESHRYRASAGARAINELKPILGLELTATPYIETGKIAQPFKNVVYRYSLAQAMEDGFVKEPAVVTQKNFNPSQFTPPQLEEIKLQDGVRLHETVKVELETYARQTSQRIVKPFMLIIARDTTHAGQLLNLIESDTFFEGRYKGKAIQVDSSKTGAEEDEMVARLLAVESADEPTEIVIHVNMLKEGWDVTNLYTIVPLRAANARVLIEQSIGRGLRLPYGKRTGLMIKDKDGHSRVHPVDRLCIVAHDKFQEIVDEANRPDSPIKMQIVELEPAPDQKRFKSVVIGSNVSYQLSSKSSAMGPATGPTDAPAAEHIGTPPAPAFGSAPAQQVASITLDAVKRLEYLPRITELQKPEVQARLVREVRAQYAPAQFALEGTEAPLDIEAIVEQVVSLVIAGTIEIPRIVVVPKGDFAVGYAAFTLELSGVQLQPVSRDLLIQHLRTQQQETISFNSQGTHEQRLEDYIVRGLMDFDDVSYDDHSDLLYDLAGQVVQHLQSYLSSEDDVHNVLVYHQKRLANLVHVQMSEHRWERATDYEVKVNAGFGELKNSAATVDADAVVLDFRSAVDDKARIAQMLFGGFKRCLFPVQKFHSDPERRLAVIVDRDGQKWFRPALEQFAIFYPFQGDSHRYQPDFVVESERFIDILECKASNELNSPEVLAKAEAARKWCRLASDHARHYGGKPWRYALIPHDVVAANMELEGLVVLHQKR